MINTFSEQLEKSYNEKETTEIFYYLCQQMTPIDIKKCFIKQNIRSKLTDRIISYALMGCAGENKVENAMTLLEYAEKYKQTTLQSEYYYYNSGVNLAIQKGYFDLAEKIIIKSSCLIRKEDSLLKLEEPEEYGINLSMGNIGGTDDNNTSIIENKYHKYSNNPLEHFTNKEDELKFLLTQEIHLNRIKNMIKPCIEEKNITPLITLVKSKYLEPLLQDKEFNTYMNSDNYKEMKKEFNNLIQNAVLEKKLDNNMPLKNNKSESFKI